MSECEGELFNPGAFVSRCRDEECNENDDGTAACHTLITDIVVLRRCASLTP